MNQITKFSEQEIADFNIHMAKLLGIMVRFLREIKGIKEIKLAELSDKTVQVISDMELGKKLSDYTEYARVAFALGTNMSILSNFNSCPKAVEYINEHNLHCLLINNLIIPQQPSTTNNKSAQADS